MKIIFASIWQRIVAFMVDYLLIAIYLVFLVLIGLGGRSIFPNAIAFIFSKRVLAQVVGFLLITLPVTLYFASTESSAKQASLGKQKMKLKVVDVQGNKLSLVHAVARNLLKFLPWELAHTCIWSLAFSQNNSSVWINAGFVTVYVLVGANFLRSLLSKTHQSLYDFIARTYVIKS